MMGGAGGHAPGRVADFDKTLKLVAEHPSEPPQDGFNPHGISVRPELNLMVTSDFICPSTTLHAVPGALDFRGSVRVWNFRERKILRTVTLPHASGSIDIRLIPRDEEKRAYTAGMTTFGSPASCAAIASIAAASCRRSTSSGTLVASSL